MYADKRGSGNRKNLGNRRVPRSVPFTSSKVAHRHRWMMSGIAFVSPCMRPCKLMLKTATGDFLSRNLVLQTDSYKFTHWKQYPPGTQHVYSYLESRGGMFPQTLFFGLQYYLLRYLCGSVGNKKNVREAQEFVDRHIAPGIFNVDGWMHIVRSHGGK